MQKTEEKIIQQTIRLPRHWKREIKRRLLDEEEDISFQKLVERLVEAWLDGRISLGETAHTITPGTGIESEEPRRPSTKAEALLAQIQATGSDEVMEHIIYVLEWTLKGIEDGLWAKSGDQPGNGPGSVAAAHGALEAGGAEAAMPGAGGAAADRRAGGGKPKRSAN